LTKKVSLDYMFNVMKIIVINLIIISALSLVSAKEAQVLSFDSLMHKVLLNSTQAAEIKLATTQTKADAITAKTLDNPSLQIDSTANHQQASDTWSIEIEQPLRWSQFGAAQNYAQLLEATSQLEEKAQLLALRHSVLRAYINCWLQQEKYLALAEQLTLIEKQQTAIKQAEEQGKMTRLEVEILAIDLLRMQQQLKAIKLETSTAKRELLQMAGLQQQDFIATKIKLQSLPGLAQLTQDLSQDAGAKALLYKQAELAQSRYNVAKKDASLPEIAPRAIYEKDEDANSSAFLVGLSISLPIWNRNQGELLRSQAQLELTQTALKQVNSGSWDAALKYHYQQAKEWRESSEVYQQEMLKGWQSIEDLIIEKFDNGQLAIADLADFQAQEVELKMEALEVYTKAIEASIALETLTGKVL